MRDSKMYRVAGDSSCQSNFEISQSACTIQVPVCPMCGSDNVVADAAARWDAATQAWGICNVFDKGHSCDDCGATDIVFVWKPANGSGGENSHNAVESHCAEPLEASSTSAAVYRAVVALLDSANDTGCTDDLIVVRKSALRAVAGHVLDDPIPTWLSTSP